MSGRLQRLRMIYHHHLLFREISNKRQKTLAIVVHRVLVRAGYKPVPDDVLRDGAEGFHVSVNPRFNGTSSVSVAHSPDFDLVTARQYASALRRELSAVIGETQAKQLVHVTPRRVPLTGPGFTDANGAPTDHLHYVEVTVQVPEDKHLRALHARLGRQ